MAATHSQSFKERVYNIVITGENFNEKCTLRNILASSRRTACRRFDPKFINKRSPTVHAIWSSYLQNTKLKIIIAPLADCTHYHELLQSMKSYGHRYILYVQNCRLNNEDDNMQNIQHLMSFFGNYKTRYIPVIYRDLKQLQEPVTQQEISFLQQFPDTHCHAPLINKDSNQEMTQHILLDYIRYAAQREKPQAFKEYRTDLYLCYKNPCAEEPSGDIAFCPSNSIHTPFGLTMQVSSNSIEVDVTYSESEICDDDLVLFDEALAKGITKSHHVRVMIVGPNGAGKTTLIKMLQLKSMCCDTLRQPTEGIEIEKTLIRCRRVDGNLKWEAEGAGNDFKGKLDAQKVAFAMKGIEEDINNRRTAVSTSTLDSSSPNSNFSRTDNESMYVDNSVSSGTYWSQNDDNFENIDDGASEDRNSSESDTVSLDSSSQITSDEEEKFDKAFVKNALWHKEHSMVPWTYCSFWDFAGHAAYYSTHQLFMSASVIYLLVVDLSKDMESPIEHQPDTKGTGMFQMTLLESLKFWFGSIQQHVIDSDVRICLVATHKDKITESSMITQKLAYLSEELKVELQCYVLDNTQSKDDDLISLTEFIESSACELADKHIPANWRKLEDFIEHTIQEGRSVVMFQEFMEHVHSLGLARNQALLFLHYQHSRGQILFFSKENATLRRPFTGNSDDSMLGTIDPATAIYLDPMVLVQFINHILKRRPKENYAIGLRIQSVPYIAEGVLDDQYLTDTLTSVDNANLKKNKDYFVKELIDLHIIFKFRVAEKEYMFMPCLMREQPPDDTIQFERATEKTSVLVIRLNISYISQAVFHQLVAALHMHYTPFKQTVNNVNRMQFYYGYISFSLSASGLQQMQIFWKSHGIHLRISNFARETSLNGIVNEEGITLCQEAFYTTLDCLNEVLSMWRNSPDYEVMVICPEHTMPPALIPFDSLVEENGYLCPCEEPHEITTGRALKFWISPNSLAQRSISPAIEHNRCPTSKEIARIALNVEVNIHALAHVLKIEDGTMKAAIIICDNPNDTKMQALKLLLHWKQENGSEATFGLLRKKLGKLIKQREGNWIRRIVTEDVKSETYGLPTDILQAIPDERSLSYCISRNLLPGKDYFFFLELGLSVPAIKQAKEQNRTFEKYAFELLMVWKHRDMNKATFQRLLDTANYVGMDTSQMVQYIRRGIP